MLTFLRASRCSAFSARSFSWLLRFLSRVSGTRIWSLVGTLLYGCQSARMGRCAQAKKCGTVGLLALMHSPLHTRSSEI
jgi:hypothetical protein